MLASSRALSPRSFALSVSLSRSLTNASRTPSDSYDAVIVGAGHNGLVAANYLARAGKRVAVFESRPVIGGAAVSEEIIPGFTFSRCSYVCSLLRPHIIRDLKLKDYGLTLYPRDPSSFTPTLDGRYLMLGSDAQFNYNEISKFSKKDAENFHRYETALNGFVEVFEHFLDRSPLSMDIMQQKTLRGKAELMKDMVEAGQHLLRLGDRVPEFVEIITAPAAKILERWFESEPLLSTLATDAVIGAMASPHTPGSGLVLFHHVMGETDGARGVWAYVRGGMGGVSNALAAAAISTGNVEIYTGERVAEIMVEGERERVNGVHLESGKSVKANLVMSNATPHITFEKLLPASSLPSDFLSSIRSIDYTSPVFKLNVALSRLPNFTACPNDPSNPNQAGPQHRGTIHLTTSLAELQQAFEDSDQRSEPSLRPVVEVTLPTAMDKSMAPEGAHVAHMFVQYAPYSPKDGSWDDPAYKERFVQRIFSVCDEFAPGFSDSVVGYDALSPVDLEREFGLTGGNIFHGSMGLDQFFWSRPVPTHSRYATPLSGLYLCGAGAHPGGGVMGAPGYNAVRQALMDGE